MTERLRQHIQKLVPGFAYDWDRMAPLFHTKTVKMHEPLLTEGETCQHIYFVNTGCLYIYYGQGAEKNVIHFALENWWMTDYKAFTDGHPAEFTVAAMEDSEVTYMSRKDYRTLQLRFPFMAAYFNQIHERAYGAALFKQKVYASVSKQDFYRYFKNTYPAVMARIPDDVFAAYMGVSPQVLRAIKAETVS